ncbi:MAG: methyltransferase domain-containing protein [Myxococcota bacterium]
MAYDLSPAEVQCPICGRAEAEVLWSVDAAQVTRMALLSERDPRRAEALQDHIEALWGGRNCRVVRCRSCTFEFADPFVAGDARFYELIYEGFEYARHKWDWEVTAERLRTLVANGDAGDEALLEVGAGSGAFLRELVPEILKPEQVVCTEFNPEALDRLREMKVHPIAGDFRTLDASFANRFSFVCMFHVLEHLDQLDLVFECLTRVTTPAARLFISLPNPINAEFHETRDVWLEWPPHHVGRWRRRPFEVIGERFGWEVVDHRIEPVGAAVFLKLFAFNRMIQRSREPGSLSRRARLIRDRRLRLAACAPFVVMEALRAVPLLAHLRGGDLGRSHWVEMRRA